MRAVVVMARANVAIITTVTEAAVMMSTVGMGVFSVVGGVTLLVTALKYDATNVRVPVIWHVTAEAHGAVITATMTTREVHLPRGPVA